MNNPLINILIRTSNRPEYFGRCIKSIRQQNYTNYTIIVSADNEDTAAYVRKNGIEPIMVKRLERSATQTFPWNLYLNTLKNQVKEGYIIILDDDDYFANTNSLALVARSIMPIESSILVYRMRYPDGRILPDDAHFCTTPFERKHISMQCFCFPATIKDKIDFDGQRAGDFRFINKLLDHVSKVYWLDRVIVTLSNFGLNGAKKDLHNEKN